MDAADLPVPGLLWGPYPEKPASRAVPTGAAALLRRLRGWAAVPPGRRHRSGVAEIRAREAALAARSPEAFAAALLDLRCALRRDGLRDEHLVAGLAVAGTAFARVLNLRVFDTQLTAARIVLDNRLAEMATGEGKTVAVALAAATAALAGIPVHVLTANDYLVARDAAAMGPVYAALGLSVGAVVQSLDPQGRRNAYRCDITYCTAREVVFDYLRDGMRRTDPVRERIDRLCGTAGEPLLLRGLCMAIVDEADSVLIDEACVPFVLSRQADAGAEVAYLATALELARGLDEGKHFRLDPAALAAELTEPGRMRVEEAAEEFGPVWRNRVHREDTVCRALEALHLYCRDAHYLVRDGKVQIVDATTGRIAEGRAWSRGLHQSIELKEGCDPTRPLETAARITYQRFFPRYLRLGGLSGTLGESRGELLSVYGLAVSTVPLRLPGRRSVLPARLFADRDALWPAVAARVAALRAEGRPVLVGTESVADSEALSRRLAEAGVDHAVLNARHDREEAEIVAGAGRRGAVTVATNMAGRGTDIALAPGVAELGGLHILCCQLNGARRIDRQLGGRCARQGDPGSVETWLAADAALLRRMLPVWLRAFAQRAAPALSDPIVRLLAGLLQRFEEHRDRVRRRRMLEADERTRRSLSCGGPLS